MIVLNYPCCYFSLVVVLTLENEILGFPIMSYPKPVSPLSHPMLLSNILLMLLLDLHSTSPNPKSMAGMPEDGNAVLIAFIPVGLSPSLGNTSKSMNDL